MVWSRQLYDGSHGLANRYEVLMTPQEVDLLPWEDPLFDQLWLPDREQLTPITNLPPRQCVPEELPV